jgi:hypothetical protein
MGPLNDSYDFQRDAPSNAQSAFSRHPQRMLFAANTEFFRLVSIQDKNTKGNETFGSPWWFTRSTLHRIIQKSDPKFLGISDIARIRLGVPSSINPHMDWLCVIYLTHSVFGWIGMASRQLASDKANIYYGAGEEQVFLPNLASSSAMSSNFAKMRYFGMCPEYF